MESATLTRRRSGKALAARLRAVPVRAWAIGAFLLLCVGALVGFLVYPTYPNYDSYYALLWGREVLDLHTPSFEAYRAPTEHPLAVAFGAVLSLLGQGADRVLVACTIASFLVLVWGVYRLGRVAFTPLVGAVAAALLLTRFDFAFLAVRGYLDIPYLALVIWAAVLEAERPRRGIPVLALLAAAALLRPEAWVLAGLYFLWVAWPAPWRDRVRYAALTAVGPLVWAAVDAAVTGDPMFSLHATSGLAEELGRQRKLADVPTALPSFLSALVKPPVLFAALAGLALATWLVPRRTAMPAALLASGIGTFLLLALAGLSVIQRYLLVPSLALLLFAAFALAGWTVLREGTFLRRAWALGALAVVVYGTVFTATRVNLNRFDSELAFRGDSHTALERVLATRAVRDGLRCGPLTVPNHKLIPDVRWVLDLPRARVLARSDAGGPVPRRGVALLVTGRKALFKQAYTIPTDSALIQVPPAGFERRALGPPFYSAYVRC